MIRPALAALALLAGCAQPSSDPAAIPADKVPVPTVADLSEGRARSLCRNAVEAEKFTVLQVSDVTPVSAGGRRSGTELTMRIVQRGQERTVRCTFTDAMGTVSLGEI